MGHDIYVTAGDEELHYARYGAGDTSAELYYDIFNAEDHYNGCSGDGGSIEFDRHELKKLQRRFQITKSIWGFRSFKIYRGDYPKYQAKESFQKISGSLKAIKNFFKNHPPQISDYKYFLIKNINQNLPQCISDRIANFAASEPLVTITFA